jgi:hypothetical protein
LKNKGKARQLIADLVALSDENDKLAAFAQDGAAISTFVQESAKATTRRLSDAEIFEFMLMLDPDLVDIQIKEDFSEDPIVLLTKEGASFEGVITALRGQAVQLRQADGKVIHVLKSAIAALRRP